MCTTKNCDVLRDAPDPLANVQAPQGAGVADAIEVIALALGPLPPGDIRNAHIAIARRIAVELDKTSTRAAGASSLASSLQWLLDKLTMPKPDPVDEIELNVAAKMAELQLDAFRIGASQN